MTVRIHIEVDRQPGLAVVLLSGHLGIDGHRELKGACEDCLADPAVAELRLDLKAIDSTDMTALGLLLVLRERGHALHKRVSLTGCAPDARVRLGIEDVARFFPVV
jgi:anti-anti-sigma regulatory factor